MEYRNQLSAINQGLYHIQWKVSQTEASPHCFQYVVNVITYYRPVDFDAELAVILNKFPVIQPTVGGHA